MCKYVMYMIGRIEERSHVEAFMHIILDAN